MREHLGEVMGGLQALAARNRVREYLQAAVLASLQRSGAMLTLAFVGGTALRILHRLPRFSEDLDFSLLRSEGYDFRGFLEAILRDLKREGYAVEIARPRDARTVNSALVRFPGLLAELELAPEGSQALAVKLEVDTNPPAGAATETTVVRQGDRPLQLQHYDRASLLSGKVHAVLSRSWPKGRDYYDLVWYLSDRSWPPPNLPLLNAALEQTRWPGERPLSAATWRTALRRRVDEVDWEAIRADVAPLLERPGDIELVTNKVLRDLLAGRGHDPTARPAR